MRKEVDSVVDRQGWD